MYFSIKDEMFTHKMSSRWFYDVTKCPSIASEDSSDITSIEICNMCYVFLDFVKKYIITAALA